MDGLPDAPAWPRGVEARHVLPRDASQLPSGEDEYAAEPLPERSLAWRIVRRQCEVAPEEARRHLGVGQWPDLAIRSRPALPGLFSLAALLTHARMADHARAARQGAQHRRPPTIGDTLALVRREL